MSAINKHQVRLGQLNRGLKVWMRPNRQVWVMERETRVTSDQVKRESGVMLFERFQLCVDIFERNVRLHVQFSLIVIISRVLEEIKPPIMNTSVVIEGGLGNVYGSVPVPSANLHDRRGFEIINDQIDLFIALWQL